MKFVLSLIAAALVLAVCQPAEAVIRRGVSVQKVVQVNRVQRVRVQRVVVAQPVVAVQAFHAQPVYGVQQFNAGCAQQFVAPSYGVQAFSAGHGCAQLFSH